MENKIILETFDVLFAVRHIQNNEHRENFPHAKKLVYSIIVFFAIASSPESD